MIFDNYLESVPKIHSWDGGRTWTTGGFNADQLRDIYIFLQRQGRQLRFIEVGAGNSTIVFNFLDPSKVVSIAPDKELFNRIIKEMCKYCLDEERLEAIIDYSEWTLPRLAKDCLTPVFDVCLIDGEHNFPNVFLDFFYMNYMMKKGGVMFIDDLQIYSCNQLSEFLRHERDFELVFDIGKLKGYCRNSDRRILSGWKSGYNMAMMADISGCVCSKYDRFIGKAGAGVPDLAEENRRLIIKLAENDRKIQALKESWSWRLTAPMRKAMSILKAGSKK